MNRKFFFIVAFLLLAGGTLWYATGYTRLPEVTIAEAAMIEDHKVRVMIPAKVVDKAIKEEGSMVTFFVTDKEGTESKVTFDQSDKFTPGQLSNAARNGRTISIVGHVCGDGFKASSVMFPAY